MTARNNLSSLETAISLGAEIFRVERNSQRSFDEFVRNLLHPRVHLPPFIPLAEGGGLIKMQANLGRHRAILKACQSQKAKSFPGTPFFASLSSLITDSECGGVSNTHKNGGPSLMPPWKKEGTT